MTLNAFHNEYYEKVISKQKERLHKKFVESEGSYQNKFKHGIVWSVN